MTLPPNPFLATSNGSASSVRFPIADIRHAELAARLAGGLADRGEQAGEGTRVADREGVAQALTCLPARVGVGRALVAAPHERLDVHDLQIPRRSMAGTKEPSPIWR